MKQLFTILACLAFISHGALAQETPLPHYPTPEEAAQMRDWRYAPPAELEGLTPAPPPGPVRTMAEWEETEALIVTWAGYQPILREIVRAAVEECTVIIVAANPTNVSNYLQNGGVPLDRVVILSKPFDSIWVRDYGPWAVYQNDVDSLMIVDWIYNRPQRRDDDTIPRAIASYMDLPIYEAILPPHDWVHTGGNNLPDGLGTIFSSDLVLDENPGKTEAEIDQIAQLYLGAERYVKFPKLPYDLIHHLDMHMVLIDEETIIVGEYPEGVADGPQIEENLDYLLNEVPTPFGNPYRIIRVPMPPDANGRYPDAQGHYRTYTNSIFVNKSILVPIYEERYDTTALRIYREALPGYNVVGIDCNAIIPAFGALHCITKLVGVRDPLWIAHARLRDTDEIENDYPVQAIIKHRSGIAEATLYYRVLPEEAYTAVPMFLADSLSATWAAAIPAQEEGRAVQYYIHAAAHSGKEQVRPLVAPEGYFQFRVRALAPAFAVSASTICPGDSVQYRDQSQGAVSSWQWFFPGGSPTVSEEPNPTVAYGQPGAYSATLIVGNGERFDTLTLEGIVQVEGGILPYFEGLDAPLTTDTWTVHNPQQDQAAWVWEAGPFCHGGALVLDNFNHDTRNTRDQLRARFDLSGLSDPVLYFDLAYAPYNAQFFDRLRLNAIDCAGERTILYEKAGADLATAPATTDAFAPAGCSQWREEAISLAAYAGQVVVLEFENIGGYGNRLHLDNIHIGAAEIANLPPVVTIASPADGTVFTDELPALDIAVETSDADGVVRAVSFFINMDSIGTAMEAPYRFSYSLPDWGTYQLQARATDNRGAQAWSMPVQIDAQLSSSLAVVPGSSGLAFRAFPNPAKGQLNLHIESPQAQAADLQLLNPLGQLVWHQQERLVPGTNRHLLDLAELPAGAYQLRLASGAQSASLRVVVAK
jgi:agmatine/peptidylarginine deiminase/PKD repeat protein